MKTKFGILLKHLFCLAVFAAVIQPVCAEDPEPEIVRVEEDWVVYIRSPDDNIAAPQIANVIAPQPTTSGAFGMIELNHGSQPDFRSGGYQVQSWIGDYVHQFASSSQTAQLSNNYDKLEYTVGLSLTGENLVFALKNGRSRTWGKFALDGVTASAPACGITLAEYDPQFSVDNTTINVGAHRVALMYQKETRYYSADGLEVTDTTSRVIHRFKEVVQFVSLAEYEQNADYFNIEITE